MIPLHILLRGMITAKSDLPDFDAQIDLNDRENFKLGTWKRAFSKYGINGYADAEEVFTFDIIGDNYQTVQTNLRTLETFRSIIQNNFERGTSAFKMYVLPSGNTSVLDESTYDPPDGSYVSIIKDLEFQLPDDEYLFSEFEGIKDVRMTVTRGPWYSPTHTNVGSTGSGFAPLITFFPITNTGFEYTTPFMPSFVELSIAPQSNNWNNTTTFSGIIIYNDFSSNVLNATSGTGFVNVSNTTALNNNVLRRTLNFATNDVATYPATTFSVGSTNVYNNYNIKNYAVVWPSGSDFMVRTVIELDEDTHYSEYVYVPQTDGPVAIYAGTVTSAQTFVSSAISLEATNVGTASGNLYIDCYAPQMDRGNMRAVYINPHPSNGLGALLHGFTDYAEEASNSKAAYLSSYTSYHTAFFSTLPITNYVVPEYYGSNDLIAETDGSVYVTLLFTSGNNWSFTTSGNAKKALVVSVNIYPTYSYVPRL